MVFSNLSLIYSDYYYGLDLDFVGFKWDSGIQNFNIKYDFKNYISDNFKLNYGVRFIMTLILEPFDYRCKFGFNFDQLDKEMPFSLYQRWAGAKKISLSYGLRYSLFYR
jgi:hypothetical protein